MKFGKLYDQNLLNNIDWSIPSSEFSPNYKKVSNSIGNLYLGSTGWGEKSWIGKIYPPKTKPTEFLNIYAKYFNSVELNTTHYREPEPDQILKWRNQVDSNFKFCPKVHKSISHFGGMNNKLVVQKFLDKCRFFEENLGTIFFQISELFPFARLSQVEKFISYIPKDLSVAIEVRHESWFPLHKNFLDLLASRNISLVIDDVSGRRDILHSNITSNNLMIRFVGNALHPSDFIRIDNWLSKISELKLSVDNIYFFIHQPDGEQVPETLEYIKSKL